MGRSEKEPVIGRKTVCPSRNLTLVLMGLIPVVRPAGQMTAVTRRTRADPGKNFCEQGRIFLVAGRADADVASYDAAQESIDQ